MAFQSAMSPTFPADVKDGTSQFVTWRPMRWMPMHALWSNFAVGSSTTPGHGRGR